ncbi:CHASE2 domain-containing protein [Oscillatoria sp. HE19RPO]|uniref:CHASE2 domain-containing protein n=1 Tax=Oscillatoria sp. HE19RPO TaxID=2954806 RepID=UPI0020C218D5|nr:CHASE2 domain-containing protein [Oscillatoria sp. HE19RPO]
MAKLVKLSLEGEISSGYKVELIEISEEQRDGKVLIEGLWGKLPPAAEIYECYQTWQDNYEQLEQIYRGREFRFLDIENNSNVSLAKCQQLSQNLEQEINQWLDAPGFRKIEDRIRTHLSPEENIRFLIKTTDYKLWQIPWSAWDFFDTYSNAEVVFSSFDAKYGEKPIKVTPRTNVRILSIFGSDENINTKPDREQIERLKSVGAQPTLIHKPSVDNLRNLLWDKSWDIFFFAGHGDRDKNSQKGKIYLNSSEYLTPSEFKNTLKTAIVDQGLKIAFLNSCVGLEVAYELVTDFSIPVVIAMREPIPDGAAQKFLEYFLLEYADHGRPMYVAVRRAKERIAEELQTEYPSLNWLPVVCQNPAYIPPTWRDLHNKISLKQASISSLFCTFIVVIARILGLFHSSEVAVYDLFLRQRPPEIVDSRISIITINDEDLDYQYYEKEFTPRYSLSEEAFQKILNKIIPYQPQLIALDIYQEHRFQNLELSQAVENLVKEKKMIGVCRLGDSEVNNRSLRINDSFIQPDSVGFSDMPFDPDMRIRRQLLGAQSTDRCSTGFSLSLRVALQYLQKILNQSSLLTTFPDKQRAVNGVLFPRIRYNAGGYQLPLNSAEGGYQILLNYRNAEFEQISLKNLLEGLEEERLENLIKDRIVLIGAIHTDKHSTPFINHRTQNMSGVEIQAHKISHIISAVLDGRPLFWWWSDWTESLWIGSWSLMGGLLVWKLRHPLTLGLATMTMIFILGGVCWVLFLQGGWIPLIPSVFVLILTSGTLILYKLS